MDMSTFLRSIEVPGLTALVTIPDSDDPDLLRTRDGNPARIIRAYAPMRLAYDISGFKLTEIPEDPRKLARLRDWIEKYVSDDKPGKPDGRFPLANAFHLSGLAIEKIAGNPIIQGIFYTTSFYRIEE